MTGAEPEAAPDRTSLAAAGTLHDFNNALQAIGAGIRQLERLAGRGDTQNFAAMIKAIEAQLGRMGGLGTSLVQASGGYMPDSRQTIAVAAFVNALKPQVAALLDGHIQLNVVVSEPAGHIVCDPIRLESAIRNLVLNARDAMQQGGMLTLGAHTVQLATDGTAAARFSAITIADTGVGMSEEMLLRCFEPFVTTKRTRGGSGLGLHQSRVFATEAGGSVRLASKQGEGTEATILLPCRDPPMS